MTETRKRRSTFGAINEAERFLRAFFYEQPRDWFRDAGDKMRDLPKTNFDLGCKFAEEGKWHDAMFRFKMTMYLNQKYPQALYNLGCCYFNLGQMDKARTTLQRVLQETPNHADAIFMLGAIDPQALNPAQRPKQMPHELVMKFFTSIAESYNQIEAQNQYRGGVLVSEQVKPLLATAELAVVDLGCGTGIASIPYRAAASEMIGVDLTPAMGVQAAATAQGDKKLFDRVIEADICTVGDAVATSSADLVLLVNVVQFIGELDAVLATASRFTKPGGIVAVTVEPYSDANGFGLVADTGRFGHGVAYVKQIAAAHRLEPAKQTALALYPGTTAELIVFRKGNT